MDNHLLTPLVELAGSQAAFARRISAPPALVWQWLDGRRPVSPKFARAIEAEFGVSRHDLRPDVFGEASIKPAADADPDAARIVSEEARHG